MLSENRILVMDTIKLTHVRLCNRGDYVSDNLYDTLKDILSNKDYVNSIRDDTKKKWISSFYRFGHYVIYSTLARSNSYYFDYDTLTYGQVNAFIKCVAANMLHYKVKELLYRFLINDDIVNDNICISLKSTRIRYDEGIDPNDTAVLDHLRFNMYRYGVFHDNRFILHNLFGPAVILENGSEHYFINGIWLSYEVWKQLSSNPISIKWREFCESN